MPTKPVPDPLSRAPGCATVKAGPSATAWRDRGSERCGLIYELTLVRLFSVVFDNSTHAISVVVTVFMAGLALGAFLLGRMSGRLGLRRVRSV